MQFFGIEATDRTLSIIMFVMENCTSGNLMLSFLAAAAAAMHTVVQCCCQSESLV